MISLTKFTSLVDGPSPAHHQQKQRTRKQPESIITMNTDVGSLADSGLADIKTITNTNSSVENDKNASGSNISYLALELSSSPDSSTENECHSNKAYSPDHDEASSQYDDTISSSIDQNDSKREAEPSYLSSITNNCDSIREPSHFSIKWSNLDYILESSWYKLSNARKPILNSLDGCFKSGQLSAILGPSGAGKSTLVDCLVGKKRQGLSGRTGVIFEDGIARDLKIVIIPQADHLTNTLTVTETLMFASKLKNSHVRNFDHFTNVQRVLEQLDLTVCSKMTCGKLSGGQYKRVSIGQELLSNPDIMILDEPTSGLDAVTCFNTVSALRELIKNSPHPMAIIATIHQPDIEVFQLFQHVYVLTTGGRTVYEGSVDDIGKRLAEATQIIENYHENLNNVTNKMSTLEYSNSDSLAATNRCNELELLKQALDANHYNPAKLIVEVAAHSYSFELVSTMNGLHRREAQQQQQTQGAGVYKRTVLSANTLIPNNKDNKFEMLTDRHQLYDQPHYDYASYNPKRVAQLDKRLCLDYANSRGQSNFFKHTYYHCHRTWLTTLRDPMLCALQVFLHIAVPLLISYAFYGYQAEGCPKVGPLDLVEEAYTNRDMVAELHSDLRITLENLGYMFFQIYVIVFAAVCVTSLTFPLAVHVLLKEYRNGWYNLSSYFLGRTLADLPVPTFNVVLAMAISYHLTGQAESPYGWRFISVSAAVVLATLIAQTQGLMFGAFLMNAVQSAVFVAPASTAPLVVISGFLLRTKSLPWILQMLSKLSYFTYVLNGFIISRYGFGRCPCDPDDFKLRDEDHLLPHSSRGVVQIWLDTFRQDYLSTNITSNGLKGLNGTSELALESAFGDRPPADLIDKLTRSLELARSYGFNITSCDQMKPYPMLDYGLEDGDLIEIFVVLALMLVVFRVLAFLSLTWMIRTQV